MPDFWSDGFLGTRGSLMLDLVSVAMALILVALAISIYLVRRQRRWGWHKYVQLTIGSLLAVVVVLFEIDVRFVTDWQARAEPSPYFDRDGWSLVWYSLSAHLACAIPTTLLWAMGLVQALRHMPRPPGPSSYSRRHARWGWSVTLGTVMTAVSGWLFYWLAFVAG